MQREINVALRVGADQVVRGVDKLLANTDVPLENQHACMVNGLCIVHLQDLCLQAALQEPLCAKAQHVVQLLLVLGQNSVPDQSSDQGVALKHAFRISLIQCQQLTCSGSDLRKSKLCAPNLALAAQTILAKELRDIEEKNAPV